MLTWPSLGTVKNESYLSPGTLSYVSLWVLRLNDVSPKYEPWLDQTNLTMPRIKKVRLGINNDCVSCYCLVIALLKKNINIRLGASQHSSKTTNFRSQKLRNLNTVCSTVFLVIHTWTIHELESLNPVELFL